jgi:capsular polysaccharide biosynthesis protein
MGKRELKEFEDNSEISLHDIGVFLTAAWKKIIFTGILGFLASSLYLLLAPNQYEAVAKILMARAPELNNSWKNIEEPTQLISRMSLFSSLDNAVITSCRVENQADASKVVKLTIPKGVASVVELKVTLPTPELANACAASMVNLISKSQAQMIGKIQNANQQLFNKVNERLVEDMALLAKFRPPVDGVSATYFAILSEIRQLQDEREKLLRLIDNKQLQELTQQATIYVADKPIYPKKSISLLVGTLAGLFLGILIALVRKMITKLKAQSQGVL